MIPKPKKPSKQFLATGGIWLCLLGLWDILTQDAFGYVLIGIGVYFIQKAACQHLSEIKHKTSAAHKVGTDNIET